MNKDRAPAVFILIAAVAAAAAIVRFGLPGFLGGLARPPADGTGVAAQPSSQNDPYIGSPSAPLTLYYWHDFQCPFCASFDTQTLPALVSEYVDTGKLRIVFKDLVFLGPDSEAAAELSHAVWDAAPSSYDSWQEAVFSRAGAEGSGWASPANLLAITKSVPGIDMAKVNGLLARNGGAYGADAAADLADGAKFGINETPGFWMGGRSFSGAQPLGFFEALINAELAKK